MLRAIGTAPRGSWATQGMRVARVRRGRLAIGAVGQGIFAAVTTLGLLAAGQEELASLAGYATLAVALVRPTAGLAAAAILIPLHGPDVLQPIGLGISLAGATFVGTMLRAAIDRPRLRVGIGGVAVAGYLGVSAVWLWPQIGGYPASEFGTATIQFLNVAAGVGLATAAAIIFLRTSPLPYLRLIVATGVFAAAMALLMAVWGSPDGIPLRALMAIPDAEWPGRAVGPFVNANYFGLHLQLIIILAIGLLAFSGSIGRVLLLGSIGLMGLVVLATLSRGALLGLGSGVVILAFARSRRAGAVVVVAGLALVLVAYPVFLEARLDITHPAPGALGAQDRSDSARRDALLAGLALFRESPLVGTGFGRVQFLSPWYLGEATVTFPHNQFIKVLAEQGLVGVLLVNAAIIAVVASLLRARRRPRAIGMAILAAYLVSFLFGEPLISLQTSGVVWIVLPALLYGGIGDRQRGWAGRAQPGPALVRAVRGA